MAQVWLERIKGYGLGWLLAFIVLILCIAFYFFGKVLSPNEVLLFIGLLALARLI